MHKSLDEVCTALDALSTAITSGWSGEQTFCEAWGWNCPAITRHDLAAMPKRLAESIRQAAPSELNEELARRVANMPRQLQHLQTQTVPQLWGGNNAPASAAVIGTLEGLSKVLEPLLSWQVPDSRAMPAPLARRLRSIQVELDEIAPKKEQLAVQIRAIAEATEAAETLPTDLQALKERRSEVSRLATEAAELHGKIDEKKNEATKDAEALRNLRDAASKLVSQCEEAYRITTSTGLAAAFDQRANRLAWSMWTWVFGLLGALAIGTALGSGRVEMLSVAVSSPEPRWGAIWMHFILSALSIGAPLWFAWLATKQIGQRFRLAEDYAYKASVAKAYEGYRKEAARIDRAFEARLFGSALARLEEAPLRLVEEHAHGSPWHELLNSEAFNKALALVPELKDRLADIARSGILGRKGGSAKIPLEPAKSP
jgi:hypothetical protein